VNVAGLKVLPEMVRINGAYDSDCARAVWDFVRQAASEGKSVSLIADERTHSPAEVAGMVGVSRATVQRRIEDGTIKAIRRGARWRVPDVEVDRYSRFLAVQLADLVADELEF
jgi:excisionase family DNA binding protein